MSRGYSEIQSLDVLISAMRDSGVVRLYFKKLAKNNSDKQQIYVATDLARTGFLPSGEVEAIRSRSSKRHPNGAAIFRAPMPLHWLNSDGRECSAPSTKLIYYPQYPEVRISGFLERCEFAPNELLSRNRRGQEPGRILFLGVADDRRVLGHAVGPESAVAREIGERTFPIAHGVLREIFLGGAGGSKQLLLTKLAGIHRAGWLNAVKLSGKGLEPYDRQNAIGYTLEAHLGVPANGYAEPDFCGWEVKGSTVKAFGRKMLLKISILASSPTGGLIREIGWRGFVRRYGYRNDGKPRGRIDFNGVHSYGVMQEKTGMTLGIQGYEDGEITDESGGLVITDLVGAVLLKWHFAKLINHWKSKHSNVVFVPALSRVKSVRQFWFDRNVKLAIGTDFFKFLEAVKAGSVVYDTGLWVNPLGRTSKERGHQRHQIRVIPQGLNSLYRRVEDVDVLS